MMHTIFAFVIFIRIFYVQSLQKEAFKNSVMCFRGKVPKVPMYFSPSPLSQFGMDVMRSCGETEGTLLMTWSVSVTVRRQTDDTDL